MTVTASAAISAGLASPRACEGLAVVPNVTSISWSRPGKGGPVFRKGSCSKQKLVKASYLARAALSRQRAITPECWNKYARVDQQDAPGIVRRLRVPAFRLSAKSPCGGTGRRARLKIEFRKECWFDSGQGHQRFLASRASAGAASPVCRSEAAEAALR